MNPEITVIIPCYNCAAFLKNAVDSVINQEFQNWELILVDDHSTDDTRNIAKLLVDKFPDKIKVYLNLRKGASSARNFGLSKAKGKYIQFLDADDLIKPTKFKDQILALETSQADWVISDYFVTDYLSKKVISHNLFSQINNKPLNTFLRLVVGSGNPIYKKEVINKMGGYNEELASAQDWDFHLRLYFSGAIFTYLQGEYFQVRKMSESISSSWIKVYEQACDYLPVLKDLIRSDKNFTASCSQYLSSVYYLTLIHSKLTQKRAFYRKQMRDWAQGDYTFLSSRLKKILVFITGFRLLEFIERSRVKFRR